MEESIQTSYGQNAIMEQKWLLKSCCRNKHLLSVETRLSALAASRSKRYPGADTLEVVMQDLGDVDS